MRPLPPTRCRHAECRACLTAEWAQDVATATPQGGTPAGELSPEPLALGMQGATLPHCPPH
jgi:hypothetical protein